jgi:hypothetical protein
MPTTNSVITDPNNKGTERKQAPRLKKQITLPTPLCLALLNPIVPLLSYSIARDRIAVFLELDSALSSRHESSSSSSLLPTDLAILIYSYLPYALLPFLALEFAHFPSLNHILSVLRGETPSHVRGRVGQC